LGDLSESCFLVCIVLLRTPSTFWKIIQRKTQIGKTVLGLFLFILVSSACYGIVLAGWRSPRLSFYVAIKLPMLLLGTTSMVMVLNWILATILGSALTFKQVMGLTYGAMGIACWLLLSLIPVTLLFTLGVADYEGTNDQLRMTHNCLLLTHIFLIASAGIYGNLQLREGLRQTVVAECSVNQLYLAWIIAFGFVGCQLSWILRPFVGSPFYPVAFLRPDCLERNFYEFVFLEVLPFVLRGGK